MAADRSVAHPLRRPRGAVDHGQCAGQQTATEHRVEAERPGQLRERLTVRFQQPGFERQESAIKAAGQESGYIGAAPVQAIGIRQ